MKRNRFTEEQIIAILKEHAAGVSVADLCRKHSVSDASIYKWKAKFGGMDVSEAKRLRAPEDENGSEFTSNAILAWADQAHVEWHYIAPGKPMQNGFIESFNGRLGMSCSMKRCSHHSDMPSGSDHLASGLQWLAAPFATRMADASRVRLHLQPASGSDAAQCEKLRAIARRIPSP
jgi:putative transposase